MSADNTELNIALKDTLKLLQWKYQIHSEQFTDEDIRIISQRDSTAFCNLSPECCSYTKTDIRKYSECLWSSSIKHEYQFEGFSTFPHPSCHPIPLVRNTTRSMEVLTMSLFYPNNLLNGFLSRTNNEQFTDPLCHCRDAIQTASHIILDCSAVPKELRDRAASRLQEINRDIHRREDHISFLNSSRDRDFMLIVQNILSIQSQYLRHTIEL